MSDLTREDIEKLSELTVHMEYIKKKIDSFSATLGGISKDLQTHEKQFVEFAGELKKLSDKVEQLQKKTKSEISNIVEKSTRFGRFLKANWWRIWGIGSGLSVIFVSWLADHLYHLPPPH